MALVVDGSLDVARAPVVAIVITLFQSKFNEA